LSNGKTTSVLGQIRIGKIVAASKRFGESTIASVLASGDLGENNSAYLKLLSRTAREAVRLASTIDKRRSDFERYTQALVNGFEGKIFGAHEKLTTSARIELPPQGTAF
jgi:hypothetical protein